MNEVDSSGSSSPGLCSQCLIMVKQSLRAKKSIGTFWVGVFLISLRNLPSIWSVPRLSDVPQKLSKYINCPCGSYVCSPRHQRWCTLPYFEPSLCKVLCVAIACVIHCVPWHRSMWPSYQPDVAGRCNFHSFFLPSFKAWNALRSVSNPLKKNLQSTNYCRLMYTSQRPSN